MEEYISREQRIQQLKEELQSMDYIALKSYEGQNCEQYGDWKSKRQEIRDEINSLEAMSDEEYNTQYGYNDIQPEDIEIEERYFEDINNSDV